MKTAADGMPSCHFPRCSFAGLPPRECKEHKLSCGGFVHHMCFTEFCQKYQIPDLDNNAALCWDCAIAQHRDECESEILDIMENECAPLAAEKSAPERKAASSLSGEEPLPDCVFMVSSCVPNTPTLSEGGDGAHVQSPEAKKDEEAVAEKGAPIEKANATSFSTANTLPAGVAASGANKPIQSQAGGDVPDGSSSEADKGQVAAIPTISRSLSPQMSPLRNGTDVNVHIIGMPNARLAATLSATPNAFPKTNQRIMLNGRKALVFGCLDSLPSAYIVLAAYDGKPIMWERLNLVMTPPAVTWSALADDSMSDCEVRAVLRSTAGLKLPEAYLLGPSVQQTDSKSAEPAGWTLFAAYTPAEEVPDAAFRVSTPKQKGAFRMGDHVEYSKATPISISQSSNEVVDEPMPSEGSAIVYGFALGACEASNSVRRYVILRVDDAHSLCLVALECIHPGNEASKATELQELSAQMSKLNEVVLLLQRSPSAINSAMDRRTRKARAALLAIASVEAEVRP